MKSAAGYYYDFPWAGGMNSCQYGSVDLDMDGNKDLVVFDRTGNRIMPFLNTGIQGMANFELAPQYMEDFPVMYDWMILADYNADGKEDIFTYSPGYAGMIVYKNISVASLDFERVVYPYLTSFQGGGYVNILVTYVDYPGIADIDMDGDLDILTFWGLGSFVEMHKNLSMEKYGHPDSLDFEKTETCWGYFAESEESNELTLDTCVGWHMASRHGELLPHTGSTFQMIDLDGDQVLDVLLGDVDYPNLVALHNGGTVDSAHIDSYEQFFPAYDQSVKLYSLPVTNFIDVNNDGMKDLLVSPFDPNPYLVENKFSSWLYINEGNEQVPHFRLDSPDFFQGQMIDVGAGSYPHLADYNGDGLQDLFIGNYGYYDSSYLDQNLILHTVHTGKVALYQNVGSATEPAFTYITDDLAGMSSLELKGWMPAFADLDGDGDLDMVCGYEDGKLCLFENMAGTGQPMDLSLVTLSYQDIDAGEYAAPQLYDIDRDGIKDLIIGERGGNINYYKGSPGSPWMEFSKVTDSLGKINVTDPNLFLDGYSVPFLFEDMKGNTLLLVGSKQGEIYFYNGIDDNLTGAFIPSDTLDELLDIPGLRTDRGYQTAAVAMDMDEDGVLEMIAGNFSGGLEYFSNTTSPQVSGTIDPTDIFDHICIYPNPAGEAVKISISTEAEGCISGIRILNLVGEMIWQTEGAKENSITLDVSGYTSGIYMMEIIISFLNNSNSSFYAKIIIL